MGRVNKFLRPRGPDKTSLLTLNGYTFCHNILSITGAFTPQPFTDTNQDVVVIYNGQIYNYDSFGSYHSDGECIIPLYKEHGPDFLKLLDGEYAICLVDFKKDILLIATDTFATKPLWYAVGDNIGVASYQSALDSLKCRPGLKLRANTCRIYSLSERYLINEFTIHDFDLRQYKNDYTAWIDAFEQSMYKRTRNIREKLFIGLSSGYDSGAISCALNRANTPYKAYTVSGHENDDILVARHKLIKKPSSAEFLKDNRKRYKRYLNNHVEEFRYRIYSSSSDYNEFHRRVQDDAGARGLALVCDRAIGESRKIYLSGSGADEIISDYGFNGEKKFRHSNFGGLFPKDLRLIFPWASFYSSTMLSYLVKEEYVAGSFGIETRYPFLDKALVQEFLSLSHTLKNAKYKSVIDEYLTQTTYPFEPDIKRGF